MKKYLVLLVTLMLSMTSFAQDSKKEFKSESNSVEFMSKNGTFICKDFFDLPSVKKIEFQVLIMTDLVENTKMGCLRLITHYKASYGTETYIGTLDYDEIDACIQCLEKLNNNIINTTPNNYVEVEYTTKDGVEIGAYYSVPKAKWTAYVYTKNYTADSAEYINSEIIVKIIDTLTQAKAMIEEKIK